MVQLNTKEKAIAFSLGEFDKVIESFADGIVWEVVGESLFRGREEVMNNCNIVKSYFESVETSFSVENVLKEGNMVVVIGRGEFFRENTLLSSVEASDYYEFDEEGRLLKVKSYCITR